MNDDGARALCAMICVQAAKDYFKMLETKDKLGTKCPEVQSHKELMRFFNSVWARRLFGIFGLNVRVAIESMNKLYKDGTYKNRLTSGIGYFKKKDDNNGGSM